DFYCMIWHNNGWLF
nr:immunoglobulin light chain junction region [Macaca mulatta]